MQVKLHPLFPLGGILPLGHGTGHHRVGIQHHLVVKLADDQFSLYPQHRAHPHRLQQGLCLIALQKAVDPDGVGVVRHVEIDDPGIALFQLLVIHREDPALYDDTAHVQIQFPHGHGIALEGLAEDRLRVLGRRGLLLHRRHSRRAADDVAPDLLHGIKQRLSFQLATCLKPELRGGTAAPYDPLPDCPGAFLQILFPVGTQRNSQRVPLPFPCGAGKGASVHGILLHEQIHQLPELHPVKLLPGELCQDGQVPQIVALLHLLLHPAHRRPGHIFRAVQLHRDAAVFHIHFGVDDFPGAKCRLGGTFRGVLGKHLQKSR